MDRTLFNSFSSLEKRNNLNKKKQQNMVIGERWNLVLVWRLYNAELDFRTSIYASCNSTHVIYESTSIYIDEKFRAARHRLIDQHELATF